MHVNFDHLVSLIEDGVSEGVSPSMAASVFHKGNLAFSYAYGALEYKDIKNKIPGNEVSLSTIYDVASLTKVLVTTSIMMILDGESKINLDDKVSKFFPEIKAREITIFNLLTHSSGLNWWRPFYERYLNEKKLGIADVVISPKEKFKEYTLNENPLAKPFERFEYSDLNYLLLGFIIEKIFDKNLDEIANDLIFQPLEMENTRFVNLCEKGLAKTPLNMNVAATELTDERGLLKGVVHDENCYYMGGISGHSGVFSNLLDLGLFTQHLMEILKGHSGVIKQSILEKYIQRVNHPMNSSRGIGFDTKSPVGSSCGQYFSLKSFGHLGFTGCSLWIDPENEIGAILLSNRIHPKRTNTKISSFRPKFHDTLAKAII